MVHSECGRIVPSAERWKDLRRFILRTGRFDIGYLKVQTFYNDIAHCSADTHTTSRMLVQYRVSTFERRSPL